MLASVDHVGYIAADLEDAVARFTEQFGIAVKRRFERPQFDLVGAYLEPGGGAIELFTFSDPELLSERLGDAPIRLDHIAYEVADIATEADRLRARGVRFSGPDLRGELRDPVDLGGVLHLWTIPQTCLGQSLQLLQR